MGSISVACYKPRPGCEQALLDLVRNMRTANGTIIEIFEWVSQEAIAGAHNNPVVLDLWKRFT
jgi:hypothetical protein